jgi:hypothetical protein
LRRRPERYHHEQFVDELAGTAALSGQRVKLRAVQPAAV